MSKSLAEYLTWLHERRDLMWPKAPALQPLKATPTLKPLPGIRVVTFNPYGTLLHIDGGELYALHPQKLRTQIALEKTIQEFNMWNSMSRKPGQPWEYMLQQYTKILEEQQMKSMRRKGDFPALDSAVIWLKILERLGKNEYVYDAATLGDLDELAVKVAYFFHASMQGVVASDFARDVLGSIIQSGRHCGLLGNGQPFTLMQLLRSLRQQGSVNAIGEVLSADSMTLSFEVGARQPSPGLYEAARDRFKKIGIAPEHVLHISHQHRDDLVPARQAGFRTALYVADKASCRVDMQELRDPELKPDRLITQLSQIRDLLML